MRLISNSFGTQGVHGSYARKGKGRLLKPRIVSKEHREKLNKTIILNQDYKNVVRKYDKKGVLHYLDPPYVGYGNRYKIHGVTSKEVCDTAKQIKNAKVVISYDNHPEVRKYCRGGKLKQHKLFVPYSAQGGDNKGKKELLITNY